MPSPAEPQVGPTVDQRETLPLAAGGSLVEFAALGVDSAVAGDDAIGAVAAWAQIPSTAASAPLYVSTRAAGGWSVPEHIGVSELAGSLEGRERVRVAIDSSGAARVAWLGPVPGGAYSAPHVATRRPGGAWETTLLSHGVASRLQLCVTGTSAFVAWHSLAGVREPESVFMAEDHGSGWGVQRIAAGGDHPALASSRDGRVLFAWDERGRVRAAVRDARGAWSARRELPQSGVGGDRFDMAVAWDAGGEALVSWSDGRRAFLSRSAGGGWPPPEVRGDDRQSLAYVLIAPGAPSAPLRAWTRADSRIEAVRGAGPIESVASGAPTRHLLADGSGNALVCWERSDGSGLLESRESWCAQAAAGRPWEVPAPWGDASAGPTLVLAAARLLDDSFLVLVREARKGALPALWSQRIRLASGG